VKHITIDQTTYDRIACWMADSEDPSLLMESLDMDASQVTKYLNREVFDILYTIYLLCDNA
jgi:hypothetical protein